MTGIKATLTLKPSEQFLTDIIITAVEGGTNHWASVSHYQYESYEFKGALPSLRLVVRDQKRPVTSGTFAILHEMNDNEDGYKEASLIVTPDVVASGLERILDGTTVETSDQHRAALALAVLEDDAGQIDANDADSIVQAGVFGEVRYA